LIEAGRRLANSLRSGDTAARLGGDEFAILLENFSSQSEVTTLASRLITLIGSPFSLNQRQITSSTSIGIALAERDEESSDRLLRNADLAMYQAKRAGKGHYRIFQPEMHTQVVRQLSAEEELRQAVERQEFLVHYQPIVDLNSGRLTGVEALARWQHPHRGLVFPSEFIPLAEETGLVNAIDRFVLRESGRQVNRWKADHPQLKELKVNVNFSTQHIAKTGLIDEVVSDLEQVRFAPADLTVEITESVMVKNPQAMIAKLESLRSLGIGIAIDDFGTGYSSLSYIHDLPIDTVKIAKTFIDSISDPSSTNYALPYGIVKLGRILNFDLVAEGIETPEQFYSLCELRCTLGQGFFFGPPVSADEMSATLKLITQSESQIVWPTVDPALARGYGRDSH
jgi:predicted signal transduction protein with EAL and GGDEF domain